MTNILYCRNDMCWANLHPRASPRLVRLVKWHPPHTAWHCEPVGWEHPADLYVRPRFLTNSSMDQSLEGSTKTKKRQRAAKLCMLPLKQESVEDWYVQPHPPDSYVREAQELLAITPFQCDVNPRKTAQILALMAMRTGQRPRDAFDRFLMHLGRTHTSRERAPSAIRPEEVDFAGQRDGLYAKMHSPPVVNVTNPS